MRISGGMRTGLLALAGLAVALGLAVGQAAAADKMRVIFVTHGQAGDPYWNAIKNGLAEAAKVYNADVQYESPDTFDMSAMAKMIDAAVASKPDGLVVSIPDADALKASIQGAIAAGIPVLGIDSGLSTFQKLGIIGYLGQDEYQAGVLVGKRLAAAGATHIMCINMEVGNTDLDNRCNGVKDGSAVKETVLPVTMDPVDSKSRIAAALQKDGSVDAIIALGPTSAIPMLNAVKELDAKGRLKAMATFDMTPEILERVADGTLLFATDAQQFLMGYLPVVLFDNYRKYGVIAPTAWPTGPGFITKDKAAGVLELSKKGFR
ncbi:MAG: sugar ABC transporter substrate-binding protein [Dongiaceae bacterium]